MALVTTASAPLVASQAEQDNKTIHVFFRLASGKTICLDVNPYVQDMMDLEKRLGLSSCRHDDVFYTYNGKPLSEDVLLSHYSVRDGSTVFVSHRQRGGCFMVSFSILVIIFLSFMGSFCTCGLSLVVIPFLLPLLFVLPLFCL